MSHSHLVSRRCTSTKKRHANIFRVFRLSVKAKVAVGSLSERWGNKMSLFAAPRHSSCSPISLHCPREGRYRGVIEKVWLGMLLFFLRKISCTCLELIRNFHESLTPTPLQKGSPDKWCLQHPPAALRCCLFCPLSCKIIPSGSRLMRIFSCRAPRKRPKSHRTRYSISTISCQSMTNSDGLSWVTLRWRSTDREGAKYEIVCVVKNIPSQKTLLDTASPSMKYDGPLPFP